MQLVEVSLMGPPLTAFGCLQRQVLVDLAQPSLVADNVVVGLAAGEVTSDGN